MHAGDADEFADNPGWRAWFGHVTVSASPRELPLRPRDCTEYAANMHALRTLATCARVNTWSAQWVRGVFARWPLRALWQQRRHVIMQLTKYLAMVRPCAGVYSRPRPLRAELCQRTRTRDGETVEREDSHWYCDDPLSSIDYIAADVAGAQPVIIDVCFGDRHYLSTVVTPRRNGRGCGYMIECNILGSVPLRWDATDGHNAGDCEHAWNLTASRQLYNVIVRSRTVAPVVTNAQLELSAELTSYYDFLIEHPEHGNYCDVGHKIDRQINIVIAAVNLCAERHGIDSHQCDSLRAKRRVLLTQWIVHREGCRTCTL